ncbi:hypothetical protein KEM54_003151 [Ascosphaera aggregata]|nr:hypothetical protein KEM54_003151 [Ascosphaera aggregata]
MLYDRALHAPISPLPPHVITTAGDRSIISGAITGAPAQPLSEQAVLTLALIDCLCYLDVGQLEEWLPLTGKLINLIPDAAGMRRVCQERFWEAISNGEMDVQRAHFVVTWWSTRGGRETVLFGEEQEKKNERSAGKLDGGEGFLQPKL